jgi:hypothetical protein
MLRSVQRLERRGGFRARFFDSRSRREYLEYQAIARIQGTEGEPCAEVQDEPNRQEPGSYEVYEVQDEPHERLERLLRRAVHRAGEGPE